MSKFLIEKIATHLKIPFSLSREHTSNFKYHGTFTVQAHLQHYWYVSNWCILDFQSLQIFLGIYIVCVDLELYIVELLGKEYMVEVKQK